MFSRMIHCYFGCKKMKLPVCSRMFGEIGISPLLGGVGLVGLGYGCAAGLGGYG